MALQKRFKKFIFLCVNAFHTINFALLKCRKDR